MIKFWLGNIFKICEQYIKKDIKNYTIDDIYIFILYFINHKHVKQLHNLILKIMFGYLYMKKNIPNFQKLQI